MKKCTSNRNDNNFNDCKIAREDFSKEILKKKSITWANFVGILEKDSQEVTEVTMNVQNITKRTNSEHKKKYRDARTEETELRLLQHEEREVQREAIKRLKCSKAAEHEGISEEMIKHICNNDEGLMLELFNKAWKGRTALADWVMGIIVPTTKKGDKTDCKN